MEGGGLKRYFITKFTLKIIFIHCKVCLIDKKQRNLKIYNAYNILCPVTKKRTEMTRQR